MGADELSPSALLCAFGDRAVEDDRETNGRFIPPSSQRKADMLTKMMGVARDQVTDGRDAERFTKAEARFEKLMARGDKAEWQLPTLLMAVAVWNLREQGLAALDRIDPAGSTSRTESCRITLMRWAARPSVEGMLLEILNGEKPKGLRRWNAMGKGLTEDSLRTTIALLEMGRPDDAWGAFQKLWEGEAIGAGQMKMKGVIGFRRAGADPETIDQLTPSYENTMAEWRRFNDEERDLADAIREDAFRGIVTHIPPGKTSTYE